MYFVNNTTSKLYFCVCEQETTTEMQDVHNFNLMLK